MKLLLLLPFLASCAGTSLYTELGPGYSLESGQYGRLDEECVTLPFELTLENPNSPFILKYVHTSCIWETPELITHEVGVVMRFCLLGECR